MIADSVALSPRNLSKKMDAESKRFNLSRRDFLATGASFYVVAATPMSGSPAEKSKALPWYARAYRRNVIDMHITDWNEKFLSQFDPTTYVSMLRKAQVQSAVVYAHSHVGLCNFQSEVGQTHRAMERKEHLAEVIRLCHESNIRVQLYCSVIFDRWAYDHYPGWRMILANGKESCETSRHGHCCPNSPYRNYILGLTEEMCKGFDFDGIRFDMTFWPVVCYCGHCRQRFRREVGGDPPTQINWKDAVWVGFQRKREEWLIEFAGLLTAKVKALKPAATVEHQASTYTQSWRLGVTSPLARLNDFLQGDFYGDALQGSFVRKLMYNLSENHPFGFETSVMVSLKNHTAKKSTELLRAKASAALADGGAFVFIDGINPDGTINPSVYERIGRIFADTQRYEPYLGGHLKQDIGIYFSTESKCDFADNGKSVDDSGLSTSSPHVDAALNVAQACIRNHVPFGVLTKRNLETLSTFSVIVLPNVVVMDEPEITALRSYVRNGGRLYASKYTSLFSKNGEQHLDFALSDVFGVNYVGETREAYTYIAPSPGFEQLYSEYSKEQPLGLDSTQILIRPAPRATVLGTLALPYSDPADFRHYASIHCNPPGILTDKAAVVAHDFGKGKTIYVAGDLESNEIYQTIFVRLLRLLQPEFSWEASAPGAVEITCFDQPDKKRLIINLLNFQKDLPNIPVRAIKLQVRLKGQKASSLAVLPERRNLAFTSRPDGVEFVIPQLEMFQMLALEYA